VVILAGLAVGWFLWRRVETRPAPTERQLTANPVEDQVWSAAISPDGRYVAYVDQTGLYLRSIDSGETHPVSLPTELRDRIEGVKWFPGGGKLVAEVRASDSWDLWIITILGEAAPRFLYRNGLEPAISPDGRLLAFTGVEVPRSSGVFVGGINGESPRSLVRSGVDHQVYSPAWSPDGRWIAYLNSKNVQGSWSWAIEVRPAGGGPAKTLVSEASLPKSASFSQYGWNLLSWSPDWRLVFAVTEASESTAAPKGSLWQAQVDPSTAQAAGIKRLTGWTDFSAIELTVTADGKRFSFLKQRHWQDVYLGELGPDGTSLKPPRRFTLDNRGSQLQDWTRDSKAIIFDSSRNGRSEVFRQALNESVPEAIVQGVGDYHAPSVTPDGSQILYMESQRAAAGGPGPLTHPNRLMRRALAGGSPEMLLEDPARVISEFMCPLKPGSACVLSDKEGKDFVFYSLDPVRGKGNQLGRIPVSESGLTSWAISPDGSRLALIDGNQYKGRIEVLSLSDRGWHELPVETGWGALQSIGWAADGKGFYVIPGPPDFNLLYVTLAGKVKPLLPKARRPWMIWMTSPLPSPDGKYLAFQAQTRDSNVWMLENF
jgi:Tol biopolymer transport system component